MAGITLTETAYYSRKALLWGGIALAALIVLITSVRVISGTISKIRPTPPPKPTLGFGLLPPPPFPQATPPTELSFTLETPEGRLPKVPSQAKVYFMPKSGSSFSSLDSAKRQAKSLGFPNEATRLNDTAYSWRNEGGFTLSTNIITGEFTYQYDYLNDPELLKNQKLMTTEEAAQLARSFFIGAGSLPEDLTSGQVKLANFRLSDSQLIPALSLSETNIIQVALFRKNYDNLPVLPADPKRGIVWALVSNSTDTSKRIVQAEYHYSAIDSQRSETYPLKSSDTAWEELKSKKYYLAQVDEQHASLITIRRVYLAYFDPPTPTGFLEPIFVFEGDSNFMGFVSALDPSTLARPAS